MAGAERGQQRLGCMVALFLVAKVAMSAEPTAEERLFDQPQAVQDFDPIEGPHPAVALRCHWYGDLMIRETQTDSPGFGPAYVVYGNAGGARPVCRSAPTARDTKLNLQEQTLLGRKGPYVVFEPTDTPSGPEQFIILHLLDGKQVYGDRRSDVAVNGKAGGISAVALEGSALRINFMRSYDAQCSLITDGAACWAKTMRDGHFARAIASQAPPIPDCVRSYKGAAGVKPSDSSTIVYDVDMTVTPTGKVDVLSRGPVGCLPPD